MDAADRARISPYVSNLDRSVFAVVGLPEEVIAVLFAYYSRSREDLRTNLARLLADNDLAIDREPPQEPSGAAADAATARMQHKARAFHEKWVVGYGHASVAEHAVAHLAIEDVSIVASKVIEDLRLGSFTEKSTRYVVFDTASFADLPELPVDLRDLYRTSCAGLFRTYLDLQPRVEERVRRLVPRGEGQSEGAWNAAVRAHTCDLLRGLLPAGTVTNIGLTANARALAMLLTKMLSSPLAEVQRLGAEMRDEALKVIPTLVRHVGESPYRKDLRSVTSSTTTPAVAVASGTTDHVPVRLVRFDTDALERVVLALTYDGADTADAGAKLQALSSEPREKLEKLLGDVMSRRDAHDSAPRAFEASSITVELEIDYGAYRDLQRHRMLTPVARTLDCAFGATVPEQIEAMGFGGQVRDALGRAERAWEKLAPAHFMAAQYAVPLAYRVRTLWTLNLREVFHVIELRSSRQGHASYRRVAQDLYRTVSEVHPWLGRWIRADIGTYELARH